VPVDLDPDERLEAVVQWSAHRSGETTAHDQDDMTLIVAAILLLPVAAQPTAQAKDGQCPSGYRCSVGSCAPVSDRGPSLANAEGLIAYYGPDGQGYNRGLPHAATFASRQYLVQQYEPPNLPPDIIAPERPRVSPRQPKAAPPIVILPLDPPEPQPTVPAPAPTVPAERMPNPLTEWCGQEANAKAPLCRNMGSPRVQR
jgi:hypothetical protein